MTSPGPSRNAPSSLGHSLGPLRNSPLPLSRSPSKVLAASMSGGSLDANAMILRGLRRDVVESQRFIDSFYERTMLSAASREIEDDLLALQNQSPDVQVFALLKMLKERSATISSICRTPSSQASYRPLEPVVGDLLVGCKSLLELETEIAACGWKREGNATTGTESPLFPSPGAPPLLLVKSNTASPSSMNSPSKHRLIAKAQAKHEERQNLLLSQASATQGGAGTPSAAGTPRNGDGSISQGSFGGTMGSHSQQGRYRASAAAADGFRSLGVEVDWTAKELDLDALVESLLHRIGGGGMIGSGAFQSSVADAEERLAMTRDFIAVRSQQMQLQVDALQGELRAKENRIHELQQMLNETRFSPNRVKTITTVKDAPMSCEVEKQYLKEQQRARMRIVELEQNYQQLYDAGSSDRERAAKLAVEVDRLKAVVKSLEEEDKKAQEASQEQEILFHGLSKTRQEEAQMCAVAVAQLEARVATLKAQLDEANTRHELLQGNFETLFDDWCTSQQQMEEAKVIREFLETESATYEQTYRQETLNKLERVQKQLLSVWTSADENEGQKTILRQQLEDSQLSLRVLVDESKSFLERVRASTEWKLLTVKAPDETKQLLARWQAMQSEREKREASVIKTQSERIATYQQRAAAEVNVRRAQHLAEVAPINADAILAEYLSKKGKMPELMSFKFGDSQMEDSENGQGASRIPKEVREGFIEESSKRLVTFEQFWQELFPGEDM